MNESLFAEISCRLNTLHALQGLLQRDELNQIESVKAEMNELISEKYEPYFSGNAALHLLSACQRCGRCCRDEISIAVSIDDCRKIAKHLGMSQKRFLIEYTVPHRLQGQDIGSARLIRKEEGGHCPFYDSRLPGCSVHQVKPQVCSAAFYLSKMNLLLCRDNGKFSIFPSCPSDMDLRARIEEFGRNVRKDPDAMDDLVRTFQSDLPEVRLFKTLLRLKGIEIYFGGEKAASLARKLGLKRTPDGEDLKPAAFLYAVTLLEAERQG
jgi:Fe-S-cluster containining protein